MKPLAWWRRKKDDSFPDECKRKSFIKRRAGIILGAAVLFCGLLLLGVWQYRNLYDETYIRLTPSPPEEGSNGKVYIPRDLEDCMAELKRMLPRKFIEKFRKENEFEVSKYHHNLGMWMRNYWGLWQGSRLKEYFECIGIQHPDDMSGTILCSFHRHLNDERIGLSQQVRMYRKYLEFMAQYLEKLKSGEKAKEEDDEGGISKFEVNELLEGFIKEFLQGGS